MAKTREQKRDILKSLSEKISKANSIIFAGFNSLGVKENEDLRKNLKSENSEYFVTKKTLLNLALKENKLDDVDVKNFDGKIATIFGYGDEIAPAKIVDKFSIGLEGEKICFVGGVLDNKFINADEIKALAKLPSKQELYARIVGSINAPVSGFVNVLAGNIRSLLYTLKAIEEKKQ